MRRWARISYLISAWLFVLLVLLQVFLAGMVVVAGQMNWSAHRGLGHWLGLPVVLMLVLAYLGHLPPSAKRLTWLLVGTFIVQAEFVIFLRQTAPALSALHPVLALVAFALGSCLSYRAVGFVREAANSMVPAEHPVETTGYGRGAQR